MKSQETFTVVGVTDGPSCYRVHMSVKAYSASEAVLCAEGELNDHDGRALSRQRLRIVAAAVFNGKLASADSWGAPPRSQWADDRYGLERKGTSPTRAFTVVAVDPVTLMPFVREVQHSCPGNAERDEAFDWHLLAGVVPGSERASHLHNRPGPEGLPSTRKERIVAMSRYRPSYLKYLDTNLPMHAQLES